MSPRVLQNISEDCVARGDDSRWEKTEELPVFLPHCLRRDQWLTQFCGTLFLCLNHRI